MPRFAALLAACLLLLSSGCGGSSTASSEAGSSSALDCSVAGQNAQILSVMRSWYYWYPSLPASVDPGAYASSDLLLDALRQEPLDRFTYITTKAADQAFYGAGQYVGFGFGFSLTSSNDLQITQVFPRSPADQGGLARGDTVTEVNGIPVPTLVASGRLGAALAVASPGVAITLDFTDLRGNSRAVTLTSAVVTRPSVALTTVIEVEGRKVGYILFDSFIDTSTAELDQAFARFANQGVSQLVIDERYNGGGEVSVAQHLASLVIGNSYSGKALGTLTFNDKHTDQNETIPFETVTNALNLTQVLFITSESTASASEFTINALVPYVHLVTVGSATFGKPVGENGFEVCTNVLYPITFKISNAAGYGDYFDGLPPTCPAADDLTHPLGDPAESSLATALGYVARGDCGADASAVAEARREAHLPRGASRYGWRQLINAY